MAKPHSECPTFGSKARGPLPSGYNTEPGRVGHSRPEGVWTTSALLRRLAKGVPWRRRALRPAVYPE